MKAAVMRAPGGPEVLRVENIEPPSLRPTGLLLEVRAIGLQGGDLVNRRERQLDGPHVVGYQASGVVIEVGESVDGFSVGDRVVATMMHGSHAELVSVSTKKAWPIPDALSFEEAAAVPIEFATASDALFEFGRLQPGESVLVQGGAGGVGLAAVQLAARAGARVIASASDDERLARLDAFGVDHGVNYRTADLVAEVMELTSGAGVDLVVDPVGGRALSASIQVLAYRGRISWIGNGGREPVDVWPLMEKNGCLLPQFFALEQSRQPQRTYALVADLLERVAAGELRATLDRTFLLSEVAAAHAHAEEAHPFGRVVLVPGG